MADLPNITYTFPSNMASTDLRPDIIMWSDPRQFVVLAELTVCFETNFKDALQRKRSRYQDLLELCTANEHQTEVITLEVGSRRFLNLAGFIQSCKI